jgi:hypothetical protein
MSEKSELSPIKWVCVYCRGKQETPDFAPFEGETKAYRTIITEAARNGQIACYACLHKLMGR